MKRRRSDAVPHRELPHTFLQDHPQVDFAFDVIQGDLKRKKKLVKCTQRPAKAMPPVRPVRDGLVVSFSKSKRFEYGNDNATESRGTGKKTKPRVKVHTEINAGIYVLRNHHTGHAFFGMCSQNWDDLTAGTHVHKAMVRTVQMYGLGDISFQVLQRIPTAHEFHFRELEELLQSRLIAHTRRAQHVHAMRVLRSWQHSYFALTWPRLKRAMEEEQVLEGTAAAVEIQRIVRGWQASTRVLRSRREMAATAIQRIFRGRAARRRATRWRHTHAAQRIQRLGRYFVDRVRWTRSKAAIRTLQRVWRGYLGRRASDRIRQKQRQDAAAQLLQLNLWAVHCSRKWRRHRLIRLASEASVTLQRRWRGVLGRRRAAAASAIRQSHRCREWAAQVVQERWHAYQVCKFQWAIVKLVAQCRSQRTLRRAWRNYVARKFAWLATRIRVATTAAIIVQNAYRAYCVRQFYHAWCRGCRRQVAAIRIQRVGRGYVARAVLVPRRRRELLERRTANTIGAWYRAMKWRHMIHVIRRTKKATQIQAAFRKHVARKRFQACKHEWARDKAALTIQCAFRGRRARDSVAFKRWLRHQGACMECDEAVAQVFAVAYSLQLCTECALTLGQTMDGYGGLETLPIDVYRTRHRQATAIAAAYRGYAVRQKVKHGVCPTCTGRAIQRVCASCNQSFCHTCSYVTHSLVYNRHHNSWTLAEFRRRTGAATRIQARYRCHLQLDTVATMRADKRRAAACQIQGWWHARYLRHVAFVDTQRQVALELKRDHASRTIQRVYRGYCGRAVASRKRERVAAATTIQRYFRASVAKHIARRERERRRAKRRQDAALRVQCAYRQHCARAELRQRRRVAAAITIQCAFRVYAAVKTLHALQDEYERKVQAAISHMKQRRKIRAVIQIQSQYRRRRDLRVAVAKRLARAAAQRLQALEIAIFAQTIVATRLARWYRRRYVRLNACAQTIQNGMRLHWGRQARHKWRANQREKANERAIVRLQCFGRSIMAKRELKALKLGMWVECMDEASGYSYYYHTATQATTWERPPELPETTQQRDLEPTTSFGNNDHSYLDETKQVWAQVWDETFQAFYYVNQETGDTTWTAPAEWSSPTNQDQS
ncbi:hypothetical protein H310_10932 [Aphanomyces invadans]|uniref:WW domain-containing protein n=1 Tax=Aphanomyces invadans TaxID=157072 RepID=A0A024TPJ4_9STRA|nr:hypothetical protein H310_10932 [Aphanomyces invadans]ETV95894.1 hypothetical protein H310_10932 [Aphanomyces invadans]|eukprot:XP_008875645.1 hypothetical protein H310_10932 [Aphanomyces invadans]